MRTYSVGIFVPVYHRDDKVKASIESLLRTKVLGFSSGGMPWCVQMHVMVGINGASDELRNFLVSPPGAKKMIYSFGDYRIYAPSRNLGKPKIVNDMVKDMAYRTHLDYVISFDSDMVIEDDGWLLKMVEAFGAFPKWADLGALSTNQTGACCHVLEPDPIRFESNWTGHGYYSYTTRAGNEGVAGGTLMVPYHIWRAIGGYTAHRIYASDDGHFALECARRDLLMCVVNEVGLFHPPGDDQSYIEWKRRACTNSLSEEEAEGPWK